MNRSPAFSPALVPFIFAFCVLGAGLAGCGSESDGATNTAGAVGDACELTFECQAGAICIEGTCVSASDLPDTGIDGSDPTDDGGNPSDGGTDDGGTDDGGAGDGGADDTSDGGGTEDGGAVDGGDTDTSGPRITFAPDSYRRCTDDLECAVFGGNCLITLSLSRPDTDGRTLVKISDLDDAFAEGEGSCRFACTNDPRICSTMIVEGPNGEEAPFTCQLVDVGLHPYPEAAPAFPFDDTLDPVALSRGRSFASVCRPPFQFADAHSASFCQACTDDTQCDGACLMERGAAATPSGSCVDACEADADCPFGFACDDLDGSNYCLPIAGTCGRCMDHDGDSRGAGRCGAVDESITDVDCDDDNPGVYYSAANPEHPFPDRCGDFDDNCNGISDRVEQLGSADHCADCGDVCRGRAGEIANAIPTCVEDEATTTFACVAACQPGFADCDGDLSTGCETPLGDDRVRYRDEDSDGRGDPATARYLCPDDVSPGWVENNLDCDDTAANVYGGDATLAAAPEVCDGIDNDCNDERDDSPIGVNVACDTGASGICGPGMTVCQDPGTETAALVCNGTVDPALVADVGEICDGKDNDCDGNVDEGVDYFFDLGQSNPGGPGSAVGCGVDGGVGACGFGTYQCLPVTGTPDASAFQCVGAAPASDPIDDLFEDTDCDGSDGTLDGAVFVRPLSAGGTLDGNDTNPGTAQAPVATIQRALSLACDGSGVCRDIFVGEGAYDSREAITLPGGAGASAGVRMYGGFETALNCATGVCRLEWQRAESQSTIRRLGPVEAASSYPFGRSYAAFVGSSSQPVNALLQGLQIRVDSPDSPFLSNGQNAPDQIGFQCGSAGCARLEFVDTSIQVESALTGGAGTAAGIADTGATDGTAGASGAQNSGEGYTTKVQALAAGYGRGTAGSCAVGGQYNGGYAASVRWRPSPTGNRIYSFAGSSGSGYPYAQGGVWIAGMADDNPENPGPPRDAHSGCDGIGGRGGSVPALATPAVRPTGQSSPYALSEANEGSSLTPRNGTSGNGGGGGGGCLTPGNGAWTCPIGDVVGGSGGGGGCAGLQGQNGGHGGSVIGLWLVPPTSGTTEVIAEPGRFAVQLGASGSGANGSAGSNGAPGGYGDTGAIVSYYHGGNGGNGGGGGGGAGGIGGWNVATVRMCPSGTTCTFNLPPQMEAAPADYFSLGTAGGAGNAGAGGAEGVKRPAVGRTDNGVQPSGCNSSSSQAAAGSAGAPGQVRTFLDVAGSR